MSFIEKIRQYFYNNQLRKILAQNEKVTRSSISFTEATSIGILFDANAPQQREAILKYATSLEKKGKKVQLLGFLKTAPEENNFIFKFFTQKELSFARLPKSEQSRKFIQEPFDLLINLYFEEQQSLQYISAASKARFRVGNHRSNINASDLMIDTHKNEGNIAYFTQQMERILQKMNQSTYESADV